MIERLKQEAGYGLVEVGAFLVLVVIALVLLFKYL